jgi:hypothetical protein
MIVLNRDELVTSLQVPIRIKAILGETDATVTRVEGINQNNRLNVVPPRTNRLVILAFFKYIDIRES